ncbi:MAG: carboxypeptidase-like regulatory domain-containing protein [Planctomycetes bacterium]|nr:carboxypeptidase-like regulatory domain-containing protein [Planctomycetota bacterium]
MRTRFLVLVLVVGAVALSPGRAAAHDLRLVVRMPEETPDVLVTEAAFDDETPADEAKVTITDESGAVIAEAKTDERGVCKFARPGPGTYFATIIAYGHRDRQKFEVTAIAGPTVEYRGLRPDQTLGLVAGVGGLLLVSAGYWWVRRRKCS